MSVVTFSKWTYQRDFLSGSVQIRIRPWGTSPQRILRNAAVVGGGPSVTACSSAASVKSWLAISLASLTMRSSASPPELRRGCDLMLPIKKIPDFDRSKRDRFYAQTGWGNGQKQALLGHQRGRRRDFAGRCRAGICAWAFAGDILGAGWPPRSRRNGAGCGLPHCLPREP